MELSFGELVLIGLAIVVLFGPDKLPQIARELGQGVRKMRGAVDEIKTEILKETDNPVSEIKREIEKVKDAAKEFNPANQLKEDLLNPKSKEEIQRPKPSEDDSYEGPVSR